MKAITTTFKGPTDVKGARIVATDSDGNRITIDYPHELNPEDAHRKAAQTLCDKMKWDGSFVTGAIKRGYVHVFAERLSY